MLTEVALATVVGRGAPLISITELETRDDPVIVSVKGDVPPACAAVGERVEMAGTGFNTNN